MIIKNFHLPGYNRYIIIFLICYKRVCTVYIILLISAISYNTQPCKFVNIFRWRINGTAYWAIRIKNKGNLFIVFLLMNKKEERRILHQAVKRRSEKSCGPSTKDLWTYLTYIFVFNKPLFGGAQGKLHILCPWTPLGMSHCCRTHAQAYVLITMLKTGV